MFSGKRRREDEVPVMGSFKRVRVADDVVPKRKTLEQKSKPKRFFKQQSLPSSILAGNYRGVLSEYLMKDPTTRNHKLSFNSFIQMWERQSRKSKKAKKRKQTKRSKPWQTDCLLVVGGSTYEVAGIGKSKKLSVQNAAKQVLVKLGVIPPEKVKGENISTGGNLKNQGGVKTAGLREEIDGDSPWTQFLGKQQNEPGQWTKRQFNEYCKARNKVMQEQILIIMRETKEAMNVVMLKDKFPGPKERSPRRKAFRIVLHSMKDKGLVTVEKGGKKSKWKWRLIN